MHKKATAGGTASGGTSTSVTGAGKRGPQVETSVVVGIFGGFVKYKFQIGYGGVHGREWRDKHTLG